MALPQVRLINRHVGILALTVILSSGNAIEGWSAQTDQESPVAAVGGDVNAALFTGTATTSIPIEVPPGCKVVQPDLALVYDSSNGNEWLKMMIGSVIVSSFPNGENFMIPLYGAVNYLRLQIGTE